MFRLTVRTLFIIWFFIFFAFVLRDAVASNTASIIIETRILDSDPFSGMKSTQTITMDFNERTKNYSFSNSYKTGTTDFFGIKLKSVRDKFVLSNQSVNTKTDSLRFSVKGETASGVRIVPHINYQFDFSFNRGVWTVKGCHDSYPAYKINFLIHATNRTVVLYEFKHKSLRLLNLFGTCDKVANARKKLG